MLLTVKNWKQSFEGTKFTYEITNSLGKRPTKEKIQKIMNEADKNGNGLISVNEFVDYMINKKKLKEV